MQRLAGLDRGVKRNDNAKCKHRTGLQAEFTKTPAGSSRLAFSVLQPCSGHPQEPLGKKIENLALDLANALILLISQNFCSNFRWLFKGVLPIYLSTAGAIATYVPIENT
jgi:hypothetical protein